MTRRPDPADAANAQLCAAGFTPLADIVETLTAARETLGWSQRHLAGLLGVSQSTLLSWERTRTEPAAGQLLAWARALGYDMAPVPPYTAALLGALTTVLTPSSTARTDTINPNGD